MFSNREAKSGMGGRVWGSEVMTSRVPSRQEAAAAAGALASWEAEVPVNAEAWQHGKSQGWGEDEPRELFRTNTSVRAALANGPCSVFQTIMLLFLEFCF